MASCAWASKRACSKTSRYGIDLTFTVPVSARPAKHLWVPGTSRVVLVQAKSEGEIEGGKLLMDC